MKKLTTLIAGVLLAFIMISANTTSEKQINKCKNEFLLPLHDAKNKIQDDDHKTYRAEQEKKINENEKKIAELKAKKDKVKKENLSHYETKIAELEKKNNELKKRISSSYKDEGKEKWESFKKEFNHDMSEVGESINDLYKNIVD
jgi:Skp family chaperone for outer membrane proteins